MLAKSIFVKKKLKDFIVSLGFQLVNLISNNQLHKSKKKYGILVKNYKGLSGKMLLKNNLTSYRIQIQLTGN